MSVRILILPFVFFLPNCIVFRCSFFINNTILSYLESKEITTVEIRDVTGGWKNWKFSSSRKLILVVRKITRFQSFIFYSRESISYIIRQSYKNTKEFLSTLFKFFLFIFFSVSRLALFHFFFLGSLSTRILEKNCLKKIESLR